MPLARTISAHTHHRHACWRQSGVELRVQDVGASAAVDGAQFLRGPALQEEELDAIVPRPGGSDLGSYETLTRLVKWPHDVFPNGPGIQHDGSRHGWGKSREN